MDDLKKLIREVPDYPKQGILFYDLTTLLKDKQGFHTLIDRMCAHYEGHQIDLVAGIEARDLFLRRLSPTVWEQALSRFASRKSCPPKPQRFPTRWNTAAILWRCMKTPLAAANACCSAMICWPPEAPLPLPSS